MDDKLPRICPQCGSSLPAESIAPELYRIVISPAQIQALIERYVPDPASLPGSDH